MPENICGTCVYLDENNKREHHNWTRGNYESYYCKECGGYHEQTDRACRYYHKRFGCYIVTEVLNNLGYEEDSLVASTFQNWRDNYLEQDLRFKSLLIQYDILGPKISEQMSMDPLKKLMSLSLMNYYLIPILDMIHEKNNELAINKYIEMVAYLKDKYQVENRLSIDYHSFKEDTLRVRNLVASKTK